MKAPSRPNCNKYEIIRIFKTEEGLEIEKAHSSVKAMAEQLKFERVVKIEGYSEKIINFTFHPAELGQFRFNLQLYTTNFLFSPPINVFFKS